jgi:hypothetical protein
MGPSRTSRGGPRRQDSGSRVSARVERGGRRGSKASSPAPLGYPSAVTLLQAGNPDVRFTTRPIAGALPSSTEPERLLIDGQHHDLAVPGPGSGQAVQTHDDQEQPDRAGTSTSKALDPDADRSSRHLCARSQHLTGVRAALPLRRVFRRWGATALAARFCHAWSPEDFEAKAELMERFAAEVLSVFDGFVVPTITVGQENARWSVRSSAVGRGRASLTVRVQVTTGQGRRR